MISWMLIFFVPSVILFFVFYFTLRCSWNLLCVGFHKARHHAVLTSIERLTQEIHGLNIGDFREGSSLSDVKWRWQAMEAYDWQGALTDYRKWYWTLNDVLGDRAAKIEGVRV